MARGVKRGGKKRSKSTAPLETRSKEDGFVSSLHPEGSFNDTRFYEPKKRELIRPNINFFSAILNALIPIIVFVGICFYDTRIATLLLGLYIVIRLRSVVIWFIRIYQRYASEELRQSCVFEPSCSEYMILSIKKYGLLFGVTKGMKRLKRCRYPNEGEDYP